MAVPSRDVLDGIFRDLHRKIREEAAAAEKEPLPPAMEKLLRAKLALLRDLQLPDESTEKRWSVSLPFALWWGKLVDRFQPEYRGQLPGFYAGFTPAASYLSTWLTPVGVAVLTVASISLLSNPHRPVAAKIGPAIVSHSAAAGQAPASDEAAKFGGAAVKRASAAVDLPSYTGDRGQSKVEAELAKAERKITIQHRKEVRIGDLLVWQHEHTTNIYCKADVREKLCDLYDQLPPLPEE